MSTIELTPAQVSELSRLKAYFPFRIVFGVVNKDTGEFEAWAKQTMHTANRLSREGHRVFVFNNA